MFRMKIPLFLMWHISLLIEYNGTVSLLSCLLNGHDINAKKKAAYKLQ